MTERNYGTMDNLKRNNMIKELAAFLTNFSANLNKVTGNLDQIENTRDVEILADTLHKVNSVMQRANISCIVKDMAKKLKKLKTPDEDPDLVQQCYRRKIMEVSLNEYPKTQEDYAQQLELKKEWIRVTAKSLSYKIKKVLPNVLKECTLDLVFRLEEIRECPMDETPCDRFQVYSALDDKGELVMNYGVGFGTGKAKLPVKNIRVPVIKAIYERMMDFIKKSNLPMYHRRKNEGFWKGFMVRTNYLGNSFLWIEANILNESTSAEEKITNLVLELKEHFECTDARNLNIVSLILRFGQNKKSEVKVVFGDELIEEVVDDLKLKILGKNCIWSNPYGVRNLSKAILELADVNKEWAVLQIGCGCCIASLYLARECKELYLIDISNSITECVVANGKSNNIENITFITDNATEELENVMENLMAYENVCVFMYPSCNFKDDQDVILIRKNKNVKKVLIVSKFNELQEVRKLVILCQEKAEWKEPFLITRVVTVDMSPYDYHVKMIFLLVRVSLVSDEVKKNENYSDENVTEFMDATKKKVNTVCRNETKSYHDINIPEAAPARHDVGTQLPEVPHRFQSHSYPNPCHNGYSGSLSNAPYLAYDERALLGRDHYAQRRTQEVYGRAPVRNREFEDSSPAHKFARQGFNERVPSWQMPNRQSVQDAGYSSWGANVNYENGSGAVRMIPNRDGYGSQMRGVNNSESNPYTQGNTATNHSQGYDISIRIVPVQDAGMSQSQTAGRGSRAVFNSNVGVGNQYSMHGFEGQDNCSGAGPRDVSSNIPLTDQVQNYQSANWNNNNYY